MNQTSVLYTLSSTFVALLLAFTTCSANGVIEVKEEREVTIGLGDATTFNITVTNEGTGPMHLYVVRTENSLPDQNWYSSICMDLICYEKEVSITDTVSIGPKETYKIKFIVYTGDLPSTGTFQLKLMEFFGLGASELGTLDFSVSTSDDNSVAVIRRADVDVYPTPATSFLTIDGTPGQDIERIEVFDAAGMVLDTYYSVEAGRIRLDVSSLSPGAYFFRIIDDEAIRTGRFIVSL